MKMRSPTSGTKDDRLALVAGLTNPTQISNLNITVVFISSTVVQMTGFGFLSGTKVILFISL